jgi:hypothetical protein
MRTLLFVLLAFFSSIPAVFSVAAPGYYDVTDYGVISDSSDDDSALDSLIDSVEPGSVLYFPSGTYYFSARIIITNSIVLCGDFSENVVNLPSVLRFKGAEGGLFFDYNADPQRYAEVRNIKLIANTNCLSPAIKLDVADGAKLNRSIILENIRIGKKDSSCYFTNGIVLNNAGQSLLQNISMVGDRANTAIMLSYTGTSMALFANKLDLAGAQTGVQIEGDGEGQHFKDCSIRNTGIGFYRYVPNTMVQPAFDLLRCIVESDIACVETHNVPNSHYSGCDLKITDDAGVAFALCGDHITRNRQISIHDCSISGTWNGVNQRGIETTNSSEVSFYNNAFTNLELAYYFDDSTHYVVATQTMSSVGNTYFASATGVSLIQIAE